MEPEGEAHLTIESYAVVATKEALFGVHHLCHFEVGAMDVVVELRQPLQTHKQAFTESAAAARVKG